MEKILLCSAKAILVFISITLYLKLFSSTIPNLIMRLRYKGTVTRDRGVKKYVYENGRCVVYEPDINVRKYVKKYSLYTEDGYKYIQCEVAKQISYIRYDVYAFNNSNKLIDIINVNENIEGEEGYSAPVELPPETSYVKFVLRKVDAMYSCKTSFVEYSPIRYAICGAVVALATAVETVIIYTNLKYIMKAIRLKVDLIVLESTEMIVAAIIICCITVALTLFAYYRNSKRVMSR